MGRFEFLNNFPLLQRKTDWLYIKFLKVKFFKNFDFLSDFYIILKIFKNKDGVTITKNGRKTTVHKTNKS